MNEIFLKVIMERNKVISIDNIIQIIKKRSYLQGTTPVRKGYSHIEVCYLLKSIQTNRELSLVIQEKENEEELV